MHALHRVDGGGIGHPAIVQHSKLVQEHALHALCTCCRAVHDGVQEEL